VFDWIYRNSDWRDLLYAVVVLLDLLTVSLLGTWVLGKIVEGMRGGWKWFKITFSGGLNSISGSGSSGSATKELVILAE
jgi:hypothetical protein